MYKVILLQQNLKLFSLLITNVFQSKEHCTLSDPVCHFTGLMANNLWKDPCRSQYPFFLNSGRQIGFYSSLEFSKTEDNHGRRELENVSDLLLSQDILQFLLHLLKPARYLINIINRSLLTAEITDFQLHSQRSNYTYWHFHLTGTVQMIAGNRYGIKIIWAILCTSRLKKP